MAVLKNIDETQLYIDCNCGCDEGIKIRIDKEDSDYFCFLTHTNGKFYGEQNEKAFRIIQKKLKKIWAIIKNKDFYYSDIVMNRKEFEEFKKYICSIK